MADFDALLEDALAQFDDDDGEPCASARADSAVSPGQQQAQDPSETAETGSAATAPELSPVGPPKAPPRPMAFDPLGGKRRTGKTAGRGPAPASGPASRPSSTSTSSSAPAQPELPQEVAALQDDLGKLIAEWSQALNPDCLSEEDAEAAAATPSGRGGSSSGASSSNAANVLRALAEQTQRTVEGEGGRPGGPGAVPSTSGTAAGGGFPGLGALGGLAGLVGGGGEGQQMNMMVDLVMQHLMSKEVLYQPMKEICDKYPPWLDKNRAGGPGTVGGEELARYEQQYNCIQALLQVYDAEPSNYQKVMGLLQEMQACGEPPREIVEDMSRAIAADLPGLGLGPGAGSSASQQGSSSMPGGDPDRMEALLGDLLGGSTGSAGGVDLPDLLGDLPGDLKGCPVQ